MFRLCFIWVWLKKRYPTWNPGKLKQQLKPAVPWSFNLDPTHTHIQSTPTFTTKTGGRPHLSSNWRPSVFSSSTLNCLRTPGMGSQPRHAKDVISGRFSRKMPHTSATFFLTPSQALRGYDLKCTHNSMRICANGNRSAPKIGQTIGP